MKKSLVLIIALTGILTCKVEAQTTSVWTTEYQTKTYNDFDAQVKSVLPDDSIRNQAVTDIVGKLKIMLPKGLESIPEDSLAHITRKIVKEWMTANVDLLNKILLIPITWTPELEASYKESIITEWPKDDLPRGHKYCDCVIRQLRIIYPGKMPMPPPDDVSIKISKICVAEIDKKP